MKQLFDSKFFIGNRHALRKRLKNDGPIVVTANASLQRSGDVAFPFRQDSNFWYLTGISIPEVMMVMAEEEFLIIPERDAVLDVFEGAIDTEQLKKVSGINTIYTHHEGWEKLLSIARSAQQVNVPLHNKYDEHHKIFINPAKPQLVRRLKKLNLELIDIRKDLAFLRMIKQPQEITAIKQAIDKTINVFEDVFNGEWINTYPNEKDIQAAIEYGFVKQNGQPAYPSIVAGGERACTLHYVANNQTISHDELLLIDAGMEWNNYAADITRVYAASKMTPTQQAILKSVKDTHDYIIDLLKPGINLKHLQKKTTTYIGKFLKAQKYITSMDVQQIQLFFPHAVSHHLGLDVHDVADYSVPLQEGMVITVEPGIYIKEDAIGVRIEDDVLITKNGAEVLSRRLPS